MILCKSPNRTYIRLGTDVNAIDSRGITPLHLALSRLRIARDSDDEGGLPLSRKKDITQIVEMVQKYLHVTKSGKDETDELEKLASQLSLSETSQQVKKEGVYMYNYNASVACP